MGGDPSVPALYALSWHGSRSARHHSMVAQWTTNRGRGSGQDWIRSLSGLESGEEIRFARYFWIISTTMVLTGIALVLGGAAAGMGPVALICGVLLFWSGLVKIVVLHIWRATLNAEPLTERDSPDARARTPAERQS